MTYATHWSRCWALLVAGGVGLSLLVWRPVSVLTVLLAGALCAAIVLALWGPPPGPHSPLAVVRWMRVGTRALLFGGTVVAIGVCGTVLPYLTLPLLLLAVLSSPPVLDRLRHRGRVVGPPVETTPTADGDTTTGPGASARRPDPGLIPEHPPEPADPGTAGALPDARPPQPSPCRLDLSDQTVQQLSARELCHEWRRSFVALRSATSADERIRVVAQRQVHLDEMERRCPTALQAWLDSGARAAGGPDRFLVDGIPGRADPGA